MPRPRRFTQVDVFADVPYLGNPLAVVLDAEGLADAELARFARWTNLSETTFVLPPTVPGSDYRVRILTPGGELPFAGHPTLGTAHAWLEHGGTPADPDTVVQQCGAGLVRVRRTPVAGGGSELSFAAPPTLRSGPLDDAYLARVLPALGLRREQVVDHAWVDNGPGWAALRLGSAAEVLALDPDLSGVPDVMVGVVGPHPDGAAHDVEVRAFGPAVGVAEDPVTGSLNASLAQWLLASGVFAGGYRASQGARLGRAGSVTITVDGGGAVWVGGAVTSCVRGEVVL